METLYENFVGIMVIINLTFCVLNSVFFIAVQFFDFNIKTNIINRFFISTMHSQEMCKHFIILCINSLIIMYVPIALVKVFFSILSIWTIYKLISYFWVNFEQPSKR